MRSELLQKLGGTKRSLQGETVERGNRGGARVSAKLTVATQWAACAEEAVNAAEEAARIAEAEVRRLRASEADHGNARWGASREVGELRELVDNLLEQL